MRVFDQPIVARNCAARQPSAVVTQSLALLHDSFVFEQADALAARVVKESREQSSATLVRTAWRTALGRYPDDDELKLCVELLDRHTRRFAEQNAEPGQSDVDKLTKAQLQHKALARLCHMLLNTNEFLYVP